MAISMRKNSSAGRGFIKTAGRKMSRMAYALLFLASLTATAGDIKSPHVASSFDLLIDAARLAQREGRFTEAMKLAGKALHQAEVDHGAYSPRSLEAAAAYFSACSWAGRSNECLSDAEKILMGAELAGATDFKEFASFLRSYASIKNRLGQYDSALAMLNRGAEILEKGQPYDEEAWMGIQFARGVMLQNIGNLKEALDVFLTVFEVQKKRYGEGSSQASMTRVRMATALRLLGRFQESASMLQQAVNDLSITDGEHAPSAIQARIELGAGLSLIGESSQAVLQLEKALISGRNVFGADHHVVMGGRYYLSQELSILGHVRRAAEMLESLVDDAGKKLPSGHLDRVSYYQALGVNRVLEGRLIEAYQILKESLKQAETAVGKTHPSYLAIRHHVESVKLDLNTHVDEKSLLESEQLFSSVYESDHPDVLAARSLYIRWLKRNGRYEEAYPIALKLVLDREKRLGKDHFETLNSLAMLGLVEARLGLAERALVSLNELSSRTQRRRSMLASLGPVTKRRMSEVVNLALAERVVLLAENDQLDQAFSAAEQNKARTLQEQILRQRALDSAGLPNEVLVVLRDGALRLAKLESHAIAATKEPEMSSRWAKYHAAAALLEQQLRLALEADSKLKYIFEAAMYDANRESYKRLREKELFIHFVEAEGNRWFALLATKNEKPRWRALGDLSEIKFHVDGLLSEIQTARSDKPASSISSEWLSRHLIAPIAHELKGIHQLTISGDGLLIDLPWEALSLNNQPLVASFAVTQAPFIDPNVKPDRQQEAVRYIGVGLGREHKSNGKTWSALPNAEIEIMAASQLWGNQVDAVLLGANASEKEFRNLAVTGKLVSASIIHIASHGFLDPNKPESQAIVLASTKDDPDHEQDGLLTVPDWMGWNLDTDLIVLSACDTGAGEWLRGEGRQGFAYALKVAGNRFLMAARWPLSDRMARLFVLEVMGKIRNGVSISSAFSSVQGEWVRSTDSNRRLIRNWAAFGLYGR